MYVKAPIPSEVYHLTRRDKMEDILADGRIRRFDDTECWFCESLEKMKTYMEQTVLREGKAYFGVGGRLCHYPKFEPEQYVILKLTPRRREGNWYRWNQEIPLDSPPELVQTAAEFSKLKIGYLKHCNYEKLKPTLIRAGMRHVRDESTAEIAAARDMFETIFRDYTQEKDVHISGLLADLMNQKPVTAAELALLAGKILRILPDQDFFSGKMQADLIRLMHDPQICYVSGSHLSSVLKADDYIRTIRAFLNR